MQNLYLKTYRFTNKKNLPKTGSTNKSIFIISSSLGGREALSISFFTKKISATLKSKETSDPLIFKYWDEIAITVNSKNFKMAYPVS